LRCFFALFLLLAFAPLAFAGEHIIVYQVGRPQPASMTLFKKALAERGYRVRSFEGSPNLEKHLETAGRINREKADVVIAIDLTVSDTNRAIIVASLAKKGPASRFLTVEEVQSAHEERSLELAVALASQFKVGVKRFPLFPLVGMDIPGVFVRLESSQESMGTMFETFIEGLEKYFGRGTPHEG
jgi:hypothetical protein